MVSDGVHQHRKRNNAGPAGSTRVGVEAGGRRGTNQRSAQPSLVDFAAAQLGRSRGARANGSVELTSKPADASLRSGSIEIQRWSSLISLPKVPPAQQAEFRTTPVKLPAPRTPITVPMPAIAGGPSGVLQRPSAADAHGDNLRGALSRSRIRQGMLIAIAIGEALYLIAAGLGLI